MRGPKKHHKWLGLRVYPEIESRLASGQTPHRVAEWFKSLPRAQQGALADTTLSGCRWALYRLKRDLPIEATLSPRYIDRAVDKLEKIINVLEKEARLIELQLELIEDRHKTEEEGEFLDELRKEIDAARQLLHQHRETQKQLGIRPPGLDEGTPVDDGRLREFDEESRKIEKLPRAKRVRRRREAILQLLEEEEVTVS
jgi:hypothetical protein